MCARVCVNVRVWRVCVYICLRVCARANECLLCTDNSSEDRTRCACVPCMCVCVCVVDLSDVRGADR